jgi:hypothetical protein
MGTRGQYAPQFKVEIGGDPLPPALRGSIVSLSYQNGIEGSDSVDLVVANQDLRWLDHPLLAVDQGFKLSLGYAPDPLQEIFVGEITAVEPSFPNSGMPTLKVTAHDFLQRMTHGKIDRAFALKIPKIGIFPLPDVAVASLVSAANILEPRPDPIGGALSVLMTLAAMAVVPDDTQLPIRRQERESDFDFLTAIAKENGWEMYIDHTADPKGYVLRFQFLIQDYSPNLTLKWGQSLLDFNPRLTTVGDLFGVTARLWIASLQTEFVIVVSWDYDRAAFNLAIYPGLGDIDSLLGEKAKKTLSIKPSGFPGALQNVLSELLPRLNNRQTATGSCIGDPRVMAGKVIEFQGLGDQFGGKYRVTSATHTMDAAGYKTSFKARKEVWFGSIPTPKGFGGLARVQGQRIGL